MTESEGAHAPGLVGVLMGGLSTERQVSFKSGKAVLAALKSSRHPRSLLTESGIGSYGLLSIEGDRTLSWRRGISTPAAAPRATPGRAHAETRSFSQEVLDINLDPADTPIGTPEYMCSIGWVLLRPALYSYGGR